MKKAFTLSILVVAIAVTGPLITHALASFFVGDNGYIGIGTSTPQHPLDVVGSMYSRLVTATSTAIDWDKGNIQTKTLSSNQTLTFANAQAGGVYKLILNQDATGGRTVTWPASVIWEEGQTPLLSTVASTTDIANFVYNGAHFLGTFDKSFGFTPSSLLNSIISYWKLDNNSNDAANSNNGSDTGVTYVTGKINQAGDFNSVSDTIDMGNPSNLQITGPISISFWFKAASLPDSSGHPYAVVTKLDNSSQQSWGIYQEVGTSVMAFIFCGTTNCSASRSGLVTIPDTNWHHWAGTFDPTSGTLHIYLDGSDQSFSPGGSWSGSTIANSSSNVMIGNKSGTSNWGAEGTIDEVGIWSRVLNSGEVTTLYNSGSGNQYPF